MLLFISGGEIFLILVVVVMLFGADKIPEMAREIAKIMQQLKNATNEVKKEIVESGIEKKMDTGLVKDIEQEVSKIKNKVQDNIDEITGPIKRNL
ncbi:MAG: twin-arginine translocase TatA/TatE family subunit [Flavobacteriaceae bacterium]|nr:twin-arginine translocase TatA/TatE family subunit [Flavobacteriaceae bacterium]